MAKSLYVDVYERGDTMLGGAHITHRVVNVLVGTTFTYESLETRP